MRRSVLSCVGALLLAVTPVGAQANGGGDWKSVLQERLRLYGHRNWIVVADSAYPAASSPGVETVVTGAEHFEVLQTVMRELAASKHVRPIVFYDRELGAVADDDAPGINGYREQLQAFLNSLNLAVPPVGTHLHAGLLKDIDEASRTYQVLILKTNLTLPYTSVFVQLDCGYWSPDAERRLRSVLAAQAGH